MTDRDLAAALVVLRDVLHHAEAGDPDARRCAIVAADAARGVTPALTVEQVAAALGVAVITVRREITRGELGAIHVGHALRVPVDELRRYRTRAARGNGRPDLVVRDPEP